MQLAEAGRPQHVGAKRPADVVGRDNIRAVLGRHHYPGQQLAGMVAVIL